MSFTLRGRLETRLVSSLAPLLAAAGLAALLHDWWPLELAGVMIGAGLALDAAVYDRLLPYQPGWLALLLGVLEVGVVMGLARLLGLAPPLLPALAFFAGSWLLAQVLVHAAFPALELTYGDDGGELRVAGPISAVAATAVFALAGGVAWAQRPPTIHLSAGVHQGPLVFDRRANIVGEPGAIVRGGIVIRHDDVTVRDLAVVGGRNGIVVEHARRVKLERVRVTGARLDGINVRRSSVTIRDCIVSGLRGEYTQAIDISFSADLPMSRIEGCTIVGGREGIVVDSTNAEVMGNQVSETRLRGIAVNEMSMSMVEENVVHRALGVGIYCGDYSECEIERNLVSETRPDGDSGDLSRVGHGIVAQYFAQALVRNNDLRGSLAAAAFADARLYSARETFAAAGHGG